MRNDANEAFGMGGIGAGKDGNALLMETSGESVLHRRRRVQPEARVAMLIMVPKDEVPAESAAIFDAPKAVGKIWPVLPAVQGIPTTREDGCRLAQS